MIKKAKILRKKIKEKLKSNSDFSSVSVFFRLISYLKYQKKLFLVGLLFSFLNALFYVVGSFYVGYIFREHFDLIIQSGSGANFNLTKFSIDIAIFILSFILYGALRYSESVIYVRLSFNSAAKMRKEAMEKLLNMPISYYDQKKAGDLISTLINDINNVGNTIFNTINNFFYNFFNILLSVITMMLVSSVLTVIIVPVALGLFSVSILVIKRAQPHFVRVQNLFGELNGYVEEILHNIKIMNAFDRRDFIFDNLKVITRNIKLIAFKGDTVARSSEPWFGMVAYTVQLLIIIISISFYLNKVPMYGIKAFGLDQHGYATSGTIVTYIFLNWNFIGPFQNLLSTNFSIQVGFASTYRIFKIIDLPNDSTKELEHLKLTNVRGEIEFKDVYFKYLPELPTWQLKNANFTVKPGEKIALVGPTGSGKTTIINLINKFYNYQQGSITVDGLELKNIDSNNLRDNISIVSQDSFLLNDTIMNNFLVSNPKLTTEQIKDVAHLTQADHFINLLPNSYDTMIENGGNEFSQGQKQILSITRALLANRPILILDEATSNIDSITEKIIQRSLDKLMENKTCFIIAHRLSTIKNVDKILVIKDGNIIEIGNHKELIEQKGFYYNLYTSSFE
ncbi:ABC transporter ATP-binding protein [Mycoplasmopsis pullorum]|uniref:ABC transporter ATP-binding protein n=1 Tax=Mycoplasmopsis pullorum TaxID=48003 RepID=UPI001119F158|nr:ABC transporter ATP-binding protein [Mycoplasmopsis pullorum]TNK83640.1 ABC transporter ATP-binding protein [Mycoplasmopsis pullorum]TNK92353.1 ABC transporter ATP-binding protein [Mycoplasmopsis pullorum]